MGLEAGRDSLSQKMSTKAFRDKASGNVCSLLKEYDVDAILGSCDSRTGSVGAAAGFPNPNLPLGFGHLNGQPFSLHVSIFTNEEAKMQILSAWDATFPENVRLPSLLVEE